MILSAQSIRRRCVEGSPPLIDPFAELGVSPGGKSFGLSAASYDVRLDQRLKLPSRGFALASTLERFCMPLDLAATVRDKSSWARVGLAVQNTYLDPGWSGWLTLEISNNSLDEFIIDAGEPIAQLVFAILDLPTERPYSGKYQNQERGPQHARDDGARCGDRPPDAAKVDLHDVAAQLSAIEKVVRDLEYRLPGSGKPLANIALTRQQCIDLLAHVFGDATGRFLRKLDGD